MRVELKMAILMSRRSQISLAHSLGIAESRLSKIVNGYAEPTENERRILSEELGWAEADLFPAQPVPSARKS